MDTTTDAQLLSMSRRIPGFGGVLSNDQFANTVKIGSSKVYLLNLENENQDGSHWVMIDCRKPGKIVYVDSYGVPPTTEISNWIHRDGRKGVYSKANLQGYENSSCGFYAVYFAAQLTKRSLKNIITKDFTNSPEQNEQFLLRYFMGR